MNNRLLNFLIAISILVLILAVALAAKLKPGFDLEPSFDLNDMPELAVFKACLDKRDRLFDDDVCDCAEFVGHPEWCSGDIKY